MHEPAPRGDAATPSALPPDGIGEGPQGSTAATSSTRDDGHGEGPQGSTTATSSTRDDGHGEGPQGSTTATSSTRDDAPGEGPVGSSGATRLPAGGAADRRRSRFRVAAAGLAGSLSACLFYGLDRTRAAISEVGFDPLMIVGTTRIDYFWRVGLSVFIGTLVVAAVFWWAADREEWLWRMVARSVVPVVLFVSILSAVFP